jgi:hypothetical protein
MHVVRTRTYFVVLGACVIGFAMPVHATIVQPLGASGWQAEWDDGFLDYVDIGVDLVTADAVFIQKSAEFIEGPDEDGLFGTIPIVFRQIAANAVSSIVINDESITNSTGGDWDDFHIELLDGTDAVFDPVATFNSGGPLPIGWSIAPFTQASFSPDNMELHIWGGVVLAGTSWWPGNGPGDGELWIDVTTQSVEPFTVFTLKETPTPEPASLVLFGIGGLALLGRRRR